MVISIICSKWGANFETSSLRFTVKKKEKEKEPTQGSEMNRSFGIEGWKLIENSRETAEEGTIILIVWQMQMLQIRFSLA